MIARLGRRLRHEGGFSLLELMTGLTIAGITVFAGYGMVDAVTRGSAKVTTRIEANKLARPVMARLMDELHSTCVAPGVAPVLSGSTSSSLSFVHQTGSVVSPTPVKRTVSVTGGVMTESVYGATSGAPPVWNFSSTPSSTRKLLTPVAQANAADNVVVPYFRYYAFVNGQLSPTPLPTPLSVADAARATQVTVAFAVPPRQTSATSDVAEGSVSLASSAIFRFDPPGESSSQQNLPCA